MAFTVQEAAQLDQGVFASVPGALHVATKRSSANRYAVHAVQECVPSRLLLFSVFDARVEKCTAVIRHVGAVKKRSSR